MNDTCFDQLAAKDLLMQINFGVVVSTNSSDQFEYLECYCTVPILSLFVLSSHLAVTNAYLPNMFTAKLDVMLYDHVNFPSRLFILDFRAARCV